jgi:hypothetical protein
MDKKALTETDIRTKFITPAIIAKWDVMTQVLEERYFTKGRVIVRGKMTSRGKAKKADYILFYKPNIPLAVVEAKDNNHSVGAGMQQALDYAEVLDVPFAFSSNGDAFLEHDRLAATGVVEREFSLDQFPSPGELWQRYRRAKGLTDRQEDIATQDYYDDGSSKVPRYYQQVAINRTVEAIARDQNRILLVMATGTGKTYTAFQIIWRLWKAGAKKRILFLVDRNILADQTKINDFKPFGKAMTKITNRTADKAFEIYLSLYQAVTGVEEEQNIYKQFSPDFFDLVIVDECHRGSAAGDASWRRVLEYFSSATQIGLTATPKETKDVSNIDYFGDPIYTYSLKQGISDGFLAPYKVIRIGLDKDLDGWRPEIGQTDKYGRLIDDREYNQLDPRTSRAAVEERWKDEAFNRALRAYVQARTICRRLEIHDTPSPVLFHAIRRAIEAAQQILQTQYADVCLGWPLARETAKRVEDGWRVRFVLDDFNSVMRTYGRVHDDPLFLPFLLLSLRREGLSSLIVETQSGTHGMPALAIGEDAASDLRALSDHRLYTWHVPNFFGDHRIAIAAIPPMVAQDRKSPVLVRELEWYQPNSRSRPRVNPRFELYAGLDTNKPTLVPLRVHLYAKTPAWETYISRLDALWKRVFDSPTPDGDRDQRTVVVAEKAENYHLIRDACDLHANTNLDYSLIIQVDEFWQHRDTFRPQTEYLNRNEGPTGFDDIYGLHEEKAEPDRIPFVFDFGFLACRERLWNEATKKDALPKRSEATPALEVRQKEARAVWDNLKEGGDCTWVDLLKAASYVAKWQTSQQSRSVPAFDLAMVAPETFSCLVLEIWFSEIYGRHPEVRDELTELMKHRRWTEPDAKQRTFSDLVKEYTNELYCTWLLLAETLDLAAFGTRKEGFGFEFGRKPDPNAVVTRHWYKSAALLDSESDEADPMRFCRLPGTFSVRGDWFLAAVRGSRSDRLVDRALELLSDQEANIDRMIRGLALPTRKVGKDEKEILSSRLRGWHYKAGPGTLTYADVLSLGTQPGRDFHWLWRGNLKNYHAAAPIWERWLYRVLRRWKKTREYFASDWKSGFSLYDEITNGGDIEDIRKRIEEIRKDIVSYNDFYTMRDKLCGELTRVGA